MALQGCLFSSRWKAKRTLTSGVIVSCRLLLWFGSFIAGPEQMPCGELAFSFVTLEKESPIACQATGLGV